MWANKLFASMLSPQSLQGRRAVWKLGTRPRPLTQGSGVAPIVAPTVHLITILVFIYSKVT
jgi:hypothetical protein